jgi:hypothetical protein
MVMKQNFIQSFFTLLTVFCVSMVVGQTGKIKGTVTNKSGSPEENVKVSVTQGWV